jgi:hypothetical protein
LNYKLFAGIALAATLPAGAANIALDDFSTLDAAWILDLDSDGIGGNLSITSDGTNVSEEYNLENLSLDGTVVTVPEPSSTALLGLAGLAFILRRLR